MRTVTWWSIGLFVIILIGVGVFVCSRYIGVHNDDYKNASYVIEGKRVQLKNGFAETEAAPGSASKTVTRYFGNELTTDLNDDGRQDVAFLVTQQTGGSGTFYYIVAALNMPQGYIGSDGFFIGDRIAPQTTETRQDSRSAHIIIVNFADHAPGQPMAEQPTEGKSMLLTFDSNTMQWSVANNGEPIITHQ